jgi:hypothetical protein
LVLAFDLSQLITQSGSFGTVFFRFDIVLDGGDAAQRVDDLGDATALAVAGMLELVGEIVLVLGVSLQFVNAAVKILDGGPALRRRDGGVADGGSGILPPEHGGIGLLLFKRGLNGAFHKFSLKHLQRYFDEFGYRFDNRKAPDLFGMTIARMAKIGGMPYAKLVEENAFTPFVRP